MDVETLTSEGLTVDRYYVAELGSVAMTWGAAAAGGEKLQDCGASRAGSQGSWPLPMAPAVGIVILI